MGDGKAVLRLAGLTTLMLVALAPPVVAGEAEPKKKVAEKAGAPVESPALDKRVANAKVIVVGDAVRIYFVDRRYQEVPYIRAAGDGPNKAAMIVVKVVKVLHPATAEIPARLLVPIETHKGDIFSDARSPYEGQVERYVGKQGVWFGEVKVITDFSDDKSGRKPLEEAVTLLQSWDAKKNPVANALPIKQLKEVEASIGRVKLGKQTPAKEEKTGARVVGSEAGAREPNTK